MRRSSRIFIVMGIIFGLMTGAFAFLTDDEPRPLSLGSTIYVDDDNTGTEDGSLANPYNTIQEGVDAAGSGEKVYVFKGTYNENVDIAKPITLEGEDREETIIDGGGSGDVVHVSVNLVNVTGFTIKNSGNLGYPTNTVITNVDAGIELDNVKFSKISNNIFKDNRYGIYLNSSSNNSIEMNNVSDCKHTGIFLHKSSSNNLINYNNVTNNDYDGISIYYGSDYNILYKNNINNNRLRGITTFYSDKIYIRFNNIFNNYYGMGIDNSENNYVTDNNISYNDIFGISIYHSKSITLEDNIMFEDGVGIIGQIIDQWTSHTIDTTNKVNGKPVYYWKNLNTGSAPLNAGQLILANCKNIKAEGLNVSLGSVGIELGFSSNISVKNNTASNNGWVGIYLSYSENNVVFYNNASYSTYGIFVQESEYNTIGYNKMYYCRSDGLYITLSDSNTITSNIVSNTGPWNNYGTGLYVASSNNNIVIYNKVTSSYRYGIRIILSNNNLFRNNYESVSPFGMILEYSKENTVAYNEVLKNTEGITLDHSEFNNISYSTVLSNTNFGIHLTNSTNNTVDNNNVQSNNDYGVLVEFSDNNTVLKNICKFNSHGISIKYSERNYVMTNTVSENTESGIGLFHSTDSNVTNNSVQKNPVGIWLSESDYNYFSYNFLFENPLEGIALYSINNCDFNIMRHNVIFDSHIGIKIEGDNNRVSDNNITDNDIGIEISGLKNNLNSNNMFNDGILMNGGIDTWTTQVIYPSNKVNNKQVRYWKNTVGGFVQKNAGQVILGNCKNTVVSNQNISRATVAISVGYSDRVKIDTSNGSYNYKYGVYMVQSDNNTLRKNIMDNNGQGIHIEESNYNNISCSVFLKNSVGIYLDQSKNNTFHHNTIAFNTQQVERYILTGSVNFWNDPYNVGNYWTDYGGVDDGSNGRTSGDGIGDTEIPHPRTNGGLGYFRLDNFPLMEPRCAPSVDLDVSSVISGIVDAVENLTEDVDEMDIHKGIKKSLTAKLENAQKSIEKGNYQAAINQLEAFINEVEAQRGKKLTDEQADHLISEAQKIIDELEKLI